MCASPLSIAHLQSNRSQAELAFLAAASGQLFFPFSLLSLQLTFKTLESCHQRFLELLSFSSAKINVQANMNLKPEEHGVYVSRSFYCLVCRTVAKQGWTNLTQDSAQCEKLADLAGKAACGCETVSCLKSLCVIGVRSLSGTITKM